MFGSMWGLAKGEEVPEDGLRNRETRGFIREGPIGWRCVSPAMRSRSTSSGSFEFLGVNTSGGFDTDRREELRMTKGKFDKLTNSSHLSDLRQTPMSS